MRAELQEKVFFFFLIATVKCNIEGDLAFSNLATVTVDEKASMESMGT